MRYLNKVREFALVSGYRVRVSFGDGYTGEVDLWPLFETSKGPMTEPFRNVDFFRKAFVDHGTLSWPNSYDICSDVLRHYCEIGRVCAREELDAAFNPKALPGETTVLVLNDKKTP